MAKRVDDNHGSIVDGLRAVGATVKSTAAVGDGFADLVVGFRNANFLLEVKDGNKSPSRRKLTTAEKTFHDSWRGQIAIVESLDDALRTIGATSRADTSQKLTQFP